MLLAIDIGNTNISCGIFNGLRLIKQFDIPTNAGFKANFKKRFKNNPKISDSVICSVVPKQTRLVLSSLLSVTGKRPYIIGKELTVPIKNLYRKPKQVGQDRLVNAYAASILYKTPLIAVDSGTAITFDVISKNKAYLGGLIVPGMEISLKALKERTALLPFVKLSRPQMLIGTDTKNSILSGIVFGTSDLCNGIVKRLKARLGKDALVIGTGGNIRMIQEYSGIHMKMDKDLTLKGMNFTYKHAIKKSL